MSPSNEILDILRTIPWFLELKNPQLQKLAELCSVVHLDTRQELFQEGDREDNLYLVLEGNMELCMRIPNRGEQCIYTAEPLDIVGWSSLTPVVRQRTAGARALQPTRLLEIDASALRQLCDEDHDLGYIIMRRVSNVAATRLLTMRLHLLETIVQRDASRRTITME